MQTTVTVGNWPTPALTGVGTTWLVPQGGRVMERETGFETAPQPWRAALYQLSYSRAYASLPTDRPRLVPDVSYVRTRQATDARRPHSR